MNSQNIPPNLSGLFTQQVIEFAQDAKKQYGTDDLVVILDLTEPQPELVAARRSEMAASEIISASLRSKLSNRASEDKQVLNSPQMSFWFLVVHTDNEMHCVAVNASMMAPGSVA